MNNHKKNKFEYDKCGHDRASLRHSICNRLIYSLGKDSITALRERLMERWMETMLSYDEFDAKCIYYLSMEFLTRPTTIEQSSQRQE